MNATESTESCDQTPTPPPPPPPPTQAPPTANQPVAIAITPASQSTAQQPIQQTTVYHRPMERYVVPIEHVKLEQEMKFQVWRLISDFFSVLC